jgi:hypothetical protein
MPLVVISLQQYSRWHYCRYAITLVEPRHTLLVRRYYRLSPYIVTPPS